MIECIRHEALLNTFMSKKKSRLIFKIHILPLPIVNSKKIQFDMHHSPKKSSQLRDPSESHPSTDMIDSDNLTSAMASMI